MQIKWQISAVRSTREEKNHALLFVTLVFSSNFLPKTNIFVFATSDKW